MSVTAAHGINTEVLPISFAELCEQARVAVLPALRRRVGSIADDLLQEALLIAFERWDHVYAVDNKVAWIRTVAMRLANRWHQRERRRSELEFTTGVTAPDRAPISDLDLLDALTRLRTEHAAAFRLTQIDELDVAAVAARLGVAEPTVKVWVHRSRQRIAERTTGIRGRWMCETETSPGALEQALHKRGHADHIDDAMPCLVDRPVRWQLEIADGRYRLSTNDGEAMDQGDVRIRAHGASLRSVRLCEWVDGVAAPTTERNVGTSIHSVDVDGDRMRLRIVSTDIEPTNGVPDVVFREVFFHDIVYRWMGPLDITERPGRHD